MIRLDDMRIFAVLAEVGSMTQAAHRLGMPKQTVSRRLRALEESLGIELARRTTRSLTLTDVGRAYALRCAEVVRLAEEATTTAMASEHDDVVGTLRITADNTFGEAFLPKLVTAFLERHPGVEIEIVLTSRKVDLLEEGIDVAFRVGPAPDVTHLAATRLGPARLWTVAREDYLDSYGTPEHPRDLAQHQCLAALPSITQTAWPFVVDGKLQLVDVPTRMRVNGVPMVRNTVLAGLGVAHLPQFVVAQDVAAGRLVRVLAEHTPEVGGVHVVYPHSTLLSPKVREFVTTSVQRFAADRNDG